MFVFNIIVIFIMITDAIDKPNTTHNKINKPKKNETISIKPQPMIEENENETLSDIPIKTTKKFKIFDEENITDDENNNFTENIQQIIKSKVEETKHDIIDISNEMKDAITGDSGVSATSRAKKTFAGVIGSMMSILMMVLTIVVVKKI